MAASKSSKSAGKAGKSSSKSSGKSSSKTPEGQTTVKEAVDRVAKPRGRY